MGRLPDTARGETDTSSHFTCRLWDGSEAAARAEAPVLRSMAELHDEVSIGLLGSLQLFSSLSAASLDVSWTAQLTRNRQGLLIAPTKKLRRATKWHVCLNDSKPKQAGQAGPQPSKDS